MRRADALGEIAAEPGEAAPLPGRRRRALRCGAARRGQSAGDDPARPDGLAPHALVASRAAERGRARDRGSRDLRRGAGLELDPEAKEWASRIHGFAAEVVARHRGEAVERRVSLPHRAGHPGRTQGAEPVASSALDRGLAPGGADGARVPPCRRVERNGVRRRSRRPASQGDVRGTTRPTRRLPALDARDRGPGRSRPAEGPRSSASVRMVVDPTEAFRCLERL